LPLIWPPLLMLFENVSWFNEAERGALDMRPETLRTKAEARGEKFPGAEGWRRLSILWGGP
jgi:hypothetical protein